MASCAGVVNWAAADPNLQRQRAAQRSNAVLADVTGARLSDRGHVGIFWQLWKDCEGDPVEWALGEKSVLVV